MRILWKIFVFVVVAGLIIALLKAFNWNPIALGLWIFEALKNGVESIANLFAHNDLFRAATKHK